MLSFSTPSPVLRAHPRTAQTSLRPPTMLAGFGAPRNTSPSPSSGPSRKPSKKLRTIRATYLELVGRGCVEYVVFARIVASGATGWKRVGLLVAEDDNICVALGASKRAVLEHAKRLWPLLGTARELEVGYGKEDEDVDNVQACAWVDGEITSAFSPDAIQTPFYVKRTGDGRSAPIDVSSKLNKNRNNAFAPRGKGEGKTPEAGS